MVVGSGQATQPTEAPAPALGNCGGRMKCDRCDDHLANGSQCGFPSARFNTPIAAKGRIYVSAANALVRFTL
jgi:hypothetical protein